MEEERSSYPGGLMGVRRDLPPERVAHKQRFAWIPLFKYFFMDPHIENGLALVSVPTRKSVLSDLFDPLTCIRESDRVFEQWL